MAKVRDFVSGLTHCIGAGLALIGLPILIVVAALKGDAYDIVTFSLFGTSLFLQYLFSTLYHWLNIGEKGLNVFRKFDHIMIFFVISCSYSTVCLGPLRGPWGWSIFGVVWGLAILGTVFTAVWIKAPRAVTTTIYILMGWLVIIFIFPLINTFKAANLLYSLWWLLIGGIFYTIGGILYWKKIPKRKFKGFGFHEIFHIFVMLGSFCQYWFVLNYVWRL